MIKCVAVFIFFFTFFRLEIIKQSLYLSIFFGAVGVWLILWSRCRKLLLNSSGVVVASLVFFIFLQSLSIDIATGAYAENFSNTFSVRVLAFFVMSVFPALLLNMIYVKGDVGAAKKVIALGFWVQLFFWIVTFISSDVKVAVYSFFAQSDSVNLRDYNMSTRGFGASGEINFTTPFIMAFLSLVVLKKKLLSLFTVPTQLVNSNMVAIALAMGLVFSKTSFLKKFALLLLVGLLVVLFGEDVFSRFYAELSSGGRTVNSLIGDHLFFINSGVFQHLFGAHEYVFQGGASRRSDIGWVIMYNYGGALFVVLFFSYIAASSISAFGTGSVALSWFLVGIILNTKGLLLGPNAYFFITVVFSFVRFKSRSNGVREWG